jgi:hypothetical protein
MRLPLLRAHARQWFGGGGACGKEVEEYVFMLRMQRQRELRPFDVGSLPLDARRLVSNLTEPGIKDCGMEKETAPGRK